MTFGPGRLSPALILIPALIPVIGRAAHGDSPLIHPVNDGTRQVRRPECDQMTPSPGGRPPNWQFILF